MSSSLLITRSGNCCELCRSAGNLSVYVVPPSAHQENEVLICDTCTVELVKGATSAPIYWRFLSEAMWSSIPAIQVLAWRLLSSLKNESWAATNLDMLYLEDETLEWARSLENDEPAEVAVPHRDSLGAELLNGDTVVLTRSLDVKGSQLNAKMGTVVKNIRLVADNMDQVEGKIDGQTIVILTKYLRKQKS